MMEAVSNVRITECDNSIYIRPRRLHYVQDGKEKSWDLIKVHDSVAVLIFNTTRQVLVFVKQFRPAVYYDSATLDDERKCIDTEKYPGSLGITVEFCAGIVDKDQSLAEIAQLEVLEECGYDVPLSKLHKVTSYRSNVGVAGPLQTFFYAEVTDDMHVSQGGGNFIEGELIEVVELSLPEAKSLIFNESVARPVSMLFGLMWFFSEKRI